MMKIIETIPGDADFPLFESLPKLLYPSDSIRHKQSESINKEFLHAGYVLTVNDEPKARVALYNNPYLFYTEIRSACIGNYECVEEAAVSKELLNYVVAEAKKLGVNFLIGPMNGSTWDNYRYSTHNDHANFLLEPWHHLYYNEQFSSVGFGPISTYSSSIDKKIPCDHPEVLRLDNEFGASGVTIRNIDMNNYEAELKKLYPFLLVSFKTNFLYTPIEWETFRSKYVEAAKIINPEYVLVAEDAQGNVIGFIFSYDDLFSREGKSLVVKTVVRDASKQWAGLGHVMGNRVVRLAKSRGYASVVHAFMIEEATSSGLSKNFFGTVYKNYVLYGKKI